jgi:hypothetical protein
MSDNALDAQPEEDLLSWRELGGAEHDRVWGRFAEQFHFRAGMEPPDWPGIREPEPSLTWDISPIYVWEDDLCAKALVDLRLRTLRALRQCARPGEELYAILWQRACYAIHPHGGPGGKTFRSGRCRCSPTACTPSSWRRTPALASSATPGR